MHHTIQYKNWNLACETHGQPEQPAVILVHGASSDRRIWRYLLDHAKEQYFIITLDLLGHGASDKPETTYDLKAWAGNLHGVLEHFGIRKVHLAGHSFGVLILKEFYRTHPQLVRSIVILDGNLRQTLGDAIYNWMKTTLERPDYEAYMASLNENKQPFCLRKKDSDLVSEGVQNTPKHVLKGQLETMKNGTDVEVHLTVPVLAIYTRNHEWNKEVEQYLRGFTSNLDLHVWEDVSHFLMLEHPARLWETMEEFFNLSHK